MNNIDNLLKNHFSQKFSPSSDVKEAIRQKLLEKSIKTDTRVCILATICTTIIGFMIVFAMQIFIGSAVLNLWASLFFASSILISLVITIFNQFKIKKGGVNYAIFCA